MLTTEIRTIIQFLMLASMDIGIFLISISMEKNENSKELKKISFFAFLPVLNFYLLGKISDEITKNQKGVSKKAKLLFWFSLINFTIPLMLRLINVFLNLSSINDFKSICIFFNNYSSNPILNIINIFILPSVIFALIYIVKAVYCITNRYVYKFKGRAAFGWLFLFFYPIIFLLCGIFACNKKVNRNY